MKILSRMSDKELKTLEKDIREEWLRRRCAGDPQCYECCECNYTSATVEAAIKHVREKHGYCKEDAALGIKPIFIKE